MNDSGFVKIFRSFRSWEWWEDANVSRLFLNLLLEVNWVDDYWKGNLVKRGQTITSLDKLVKQTGLSKQIVRSCLNKLKSTQEITLKLTHHFTLLTVVKYSDYQENEEQINTTFNTKKNIPLTRCEHEINTKLTPIEEVKNLRTEELKKLRNKSKAKERIARENDLTFGEFENIYLTQEEHDKLILKMGIDKTNKYIEKVSGYIKSVGKENYYKSYYATILAWYGKDKDNMHDNPKELKEEPIYTELQKKMMDTINKGTAERKANIGG